MKSRIMIDLETLGQSPGCVIVALGAARFTDTEITDSFYERIDSTNCEAAGLRIDSATVMWWLRQSDAARSEIVRPGKPLREVLDAFSNFVGGDPDCEIWGNGAAFDNVILAAAYDSAHIPRPWHFTNDRCYRTVKNLYPDVVLKREGIEHRALDDAISQAWHLLEIENRQRAATPALCQPVFLEDDKSLSLRRGKLSIPVNYIDEDPLRFLAVISPLLIVYRAELCYDGMVMNYDANSPWFDEVPIGSIAPLYDVELETSNSAAEGEEPKIKTTFKRFIRRS